MACFWSEKLSESVTRIYCVGDEQIYLVQGRERAALIDSGVGVGDLKAYVEALTDLPLIVLVTHGHGDHALGAQQFKEAYLSRLDIPTYYARCQPDLRHAYLEQFCHHDRYGKADILPIPDPGFFRDLRDADVFDLGGITLEAISCGGHSPGSMMILIRELRCLITGDACNYFTMLQGDTCLGLSSYEKNLRAAQKRVEGRYNTIYLSHGFVEAPITLLNEVLEVIAQVKVGSDDKIPFGHLDSVGLVAKAIGKRGRSSFLRLDGKFGNIVYNPKRIWE